MRKSAAKHIGQMLAGAPDEAVSAVLPQVRGVLGARGLSWVCSCWCR